jgi:hypothetical protein
MNEDDFSSPTKVQRFPQARKMSEEEMGMISLLEYPQPNRPLRRRSTSQPNLPDMELISAFMDSDMSQLTSSFEYPPPTDLNTFPSSRQRSELVPKELTEPIISWSDVYPKDVVKETMKDDSDTPLSSALNQLKMNERTSQQALLNSEELATFSRYIREQIAHFTSMREKEREETRQQLEFLSSLLKSHKNKDKMLLSSIWKKKLIRNS